MEFNLLAELKSYQPFDETEKEKLEKVIGFLETGENLYSRTNLEGHVTAGGFICDEFGNILIHRHKNSVHWLQFGGHSDGNANSFEVAVREINEESGIFELKLISDKILDVDVHVVANNEKKKEPQHLHYDINFLFVTNNKDFVISDESEEIKWIPISEMLSWLGGTSESKIRISKKVQKLYSEKPEIFKF